MYGYAGLLRGGFSGMLPRLRAVDGASLFLVGGGCQGHARSLAVIGCRVYWRQGPNTPAPSLCAGVCVAVWRECRAQLLNFLCRIGYRALLCCSKRLPHEHAAQTRVWNSV